MSAEGGKLMASSKIHLKSIYKLLCNMFSNYNAKHIFRILFLCRKLVVLLVKRVKLSTDFVKR